jgi:hypothetical protein
MGQKTKAETRTVRIQNPAGRNADGETSEVVHITKRKVEAVVDTNSLKITQHAVQKKNENSGAWEHEPNESCESEYRKCAEEPWRPYLPGCTAMMIFDCNANGIPDSCEIANGSATDCNRNGIPDACDIAGGMADCNGNGQLDSCELANGTAIDQNGNGIPDSCDPTPSLTLTASGEADGKAATRAARDKLMPGRFDAWSGEREVERPSLAHSFFRFPPLPPPSAAKTNHHGHHLQEAQGGERPQTRAPTPGPQPQGAAQR